MSATKTATLEYCSTVWNPFIRAKYYLSLTDDSGVARGGPGGPWPPQTFVKLFFSAMN